MLQKFQDGRTDLVLDLADQPDHDLPELMRWCAYYGDVTAIRYLLTRGTTLGMLGPNLDLNGPCFHGHWRLAQFLLESGADPNHPLAETGETCLHAAFCKPSNDAQNRVIRVLLDHGADPNRKTLDGIETGGFMRDCRTKGETPLHRAAAFADAEAIGMLLKAGAQIDSRDARGETPLSWASWYLRPAPILRLLCYGPYRVRPGYKGMEANLQGEPQVTAPSDQP